MPTFHHRFELDHPVEQVFAWHTRPGAFERLVPPWERVVVRERTGGIRPGGRVVLGVGRGPAAVTWELEHTEYEEDRRFVDAQVRGPFARWRHEHRFEPLGTGRCAVIDEVEWDPPLGGAGRAVSGPLVESTLERLFAFRRRRLAADLDRHRAYPGPLLTVAVTGSTGFIGSALTAFLRTGGHRVIRITRGEGGDGTVGWDPARGKIDAEGLEGVDAVVHLAGEPVAGMRWTEAKKKAILRSREVGTLTLTRALAGLERPPAVLVSASGAHYYGNRGEEPLPETADPGGGFLAEVCRRWEGATSPARTRGVRTVMLRSGIVLSPAGGVLGTILLPFRLGVGGRLGSGRQYMSWIDLDDEIGLIFHALRRTDVRGPMNAAAPNPLPNVAFTDVLGRVLGRPTLLPVPSIAIRGMLGQMGEELLLFGQRMVPEKARVTGFRFLHEDVEDSLRYQLGREEKSQ